MMSISRSFTIFNRGEMPILISVIALTENEMKEMLCRITLISESYINNFAWLFCRERHELLLKCAQHVQHDYFLHAIVDCFVKFHCCCCSLTLSYTAHRALTCFITLFVSIDSSDKFWNYFLTCLYFSSVQVISEPWITAEPTNRLVHLENPAPVARGRLMSS